MRPPEAREALEGVAVVLTTVAELNVVKSALDHGEPSRQDYDATNLVGAGARAGVRGRFNDQTREVHVSSDERTYGSIPEETPIVSGWKDGAEFQVLDLDVPFVQRAARNVIHEERKLRRAWNNVTGRTKAAEDIASTLANINRRNFKIPEPRPID